MPNTKTHEVAPGMPLSAYDFNIMFAEVVADCLEIFTTVIPTQANPGVGPLAYIEDLAELTNTTAFLTESTTDTEGDHTTNWRLI